MEHVSNGTDALLRVEPPALVATIGLPGSGKTTWAEELATSLRNAGVPVFRVSRDDLRAELPPDMSVNNREKAVTQQHREIVVEKLRSGYVVIVDDTNLNPGTRHHWQQLAAEHGAAYHEESFLHVPLSECLIRNERRSMKGGRAVPESAIIRMAQRYIPPARYEPDPNLPPALLVDIDGTSTRYPGPGERTRDPYDYTNVLDDPPNTPVIEVVTAIAHAKNAKIVFLSGRDDVCYDDTVTWIKRHYGLDDVELYMRRTGDKRRDYVVKSELFEAHVRNRYRVLAVFDDRQQVILMWRYEIGLPVLQVADHF